ncbi:MAG TPA: ABC transporter permease [Bryobacteraceae bacterium]|nr:ABC transporter permease [Bryobacteraceae bacterium]
MRWKHVLRRLMHAPMFTVVTAVTLAIGIGANSAIFSVIEGVLLKPLPYPHPDRLIAVNHTAPGINFVEANIAPFLYFTYRDEGRTFQDITLWQDDTSSVTGLAEPEVVRDVLVTAGFLPLLGIQPVLGRWFSAADDSPNAPKTVVLTHRYWQARFGGDRSVLGRNLIVDGTPREIIGVMPAVFQFANSKLAMLMPLQLDRNKTFIGNFSYAGIARLKPGVTLAEASADVARMIPIAMHKFPPFPGYTAKMFEDARVGPRLSLLKDDVVGDIGKTLWILMGTIGTVLLIACANVANLMLVRADGRQQELAIRAALGAGWGRIARELLAESVAIGLLGGAIGLMFAYGAVHLLLTLAPANLPRLDDISIDPAVVLFTFGVSLLAGALFGLIPVIKYVAPGRGLGIALRAGGRTVSESRERHRMRSTLVVVQVALALLLLIGSGLMIRTFQALRHVDPGFTHPEQLQTLEISIPESQVKDATAAVRMEQAIVDKLAAIPGVSSAAFTTVLPLDESGWHDPVYAEDKAYSESIPVLRRYKFVSPGLLATMGNRLKAGRDFNWTDVYERRPVAMVSENLARELWHDPSAAIGKRVRETMKGTWREVVGVVNDEREDGVNRPAPTTAYWPTIMNDFESDKVSVRRDVYYVIRSNRAGSQSFLKAVQAAVWSVNGNLPLANVATLETIYEKSLARTSFTLVLLAIAGAMAMLIGLVGIYGVISYSVTQRTREIGIRMALGAEQNRLARMFVGHGLMLAAIGVVCGLAAAALLTRLMSSLLFEVNPVDPVTYVAVSASLIAAALLASYLPALRATKVDPVQALRAE